MTQIADSPTFTFAGRPHRAPSRLRRHAPPRQGRLGRARQSGPRPFRRGAAPRRRARRRLHRHRRLVRAARQRGDHRRGAARRTGSRSSSPPRPACCAPAPASGRSVGKPEYLRQSVELSLRRLELERIELFQLHRIDPRLPGRRPDRPAQADAGRGQDRHDRPLRGLRRRDRGGRQDRRDRQRPEPVQPHEPAVRGRPRLLRDAAASPSSRGSRSPTATWRRPTARSTTWSRPPARRPPRSRWPGCWPARR